MNFKRETWKLVFYAAIAAAICSATAYIGLLIAEFIGNIGWEVGLAMIFTSFGCVATFLLALYCVPFVLNFIVECYKYFTRNL